MHQNVSVSSDLHVQHLCRYARGKTLKQEALKKNKINTKDAIVHLLQEGKGIMPP